jgi:hypothetical protein
LSQRFGGVKTGVVLTLGGLEWLLVVTAISAVTATNCTSASPGTNILEIDTRGGREFKDKK